MRAPKILLVDDDANILEVYSANLSSRGFNVLTCQSGEAALEILAKDFEINAVVTDLIMKKMNGDVLFLEINKLYPSIPVIMLTAHGSIESAVKLVKEGAFDYLEKPSEITQFIKALNSAVKYNSLKREIQFLREELNKNTVFYNIITKSRKMFDVIELIKAVSGTDFNVLIEGESGTGKELVARAIHLGSNRKNQPFIPVNCAAIPTTLMESEMFGYEPGAFTGALNRRIGKFESANEGSLFLDEIGDLDKNLQTKLLRVLEEKIIQRIGGNNNIQTNFRLIAATNCDLKNAVENNEFREDLYYRLNVISICIPPLRERKEDIIALSEYFLQKYSMLENRPVKEITPEVFNIFSTYNWPGNIRELENVIKRAIILCKSNKIKKSDLPPNLVSTTHLNLFTKQNKTTCMAKDKTNIINALKKTSGNKSRAALLIGMDRRKFYRKLDEYDIN